MKSEILEFTINLSAKCNCCEKTRCITVSSNVAEDADNVYANRYETAEAKLEEAGWDIDSQWGLCLCETCKDDFEKPQVGEYWFVLTSPYDDLDIACIGSERCNTTSKKPVNKFLSRANVPQSYYFFSIDAWNREEFQEKDMYFFEDVRWGSQDAPKRVSVPMWFHTTKNAGFSLKDVIIVTFDKSVYKKAKNNLNNESWFFCYKDKEDYKEEEFLAEPGIAAAYEYDEEIECLVLKKTLDAR